MKPLVISMSAINTFMRCSKKYQIQYEMLLDGMRESEALIKGTAFHEIMAQYAKTKTIEAESLMAEVAREYLRHHKFPEEIVLVEEPVYVQFLSDPIPVYLRCTFDLVYCEHGVIVVRDWKTFSKLPSLDTELDFQTRLYMACAIKHFNQMVRFEHVYVRSTPPYLPKDKAGNCWSPEDCYITVPTVCSITEIKKVVQEVKWELERLIQTRENGRYTRTNLKGGGYDSCGTCSVKEICKLGLNKEIEEFTEDELKYISTKREPIEIPEELKCL